MKVVKIKDLSDDAVSYSGPTDIVIRSVRYSGSFPFHHLCDMNNVCPLPEFTDSFQDQYSEEKK